MRAESSCLQVMVAQREVEEVSNRWQFCSTDDNKRCARMHTQPAQQQQQQQAIHPLSSILLGCIGQPVPQAFLCSCSQVSGSASAWAMGSTLAHPCTTVRGAGQCQLTPMHSALLSLLLSLLLARWRLLEGPEADEGALGTRAALLEQRLASKQAELENKAAMVDLGTQLQQALAAALAEKRPQAQALACQGASCLVWPWQMSGNAGDRVMGSAEQGRLQAEAQGCKMRVSAKWELSHSACILCWAIACSLLGQ